MLCSKGISGGSLKITSENIFLSIDPQEILRWWGANMLLRVCKRWLPSGGSSLVQRASSCTPIESQFNSILLKSFALIL